MTEPIIDVDAYVFVSVALCPVDSDALESGDPLAISDLGPRHPKMLCNGSFRLTFQHVSRLPTDPALR